MWEGEKKINNDDQELEIGFIIIYLFILGFSLGTW